MKKFLLTFFILQICSQVLALHNVTPFYENGKFGLKDSNNITVVRPEFKKLIKLGNSAWLVQKKNKFGIIDNNGNFLVDAKYSHAERILGHYAKLGNYGNYGLYDENGTQILPHDFSKIDLLFGGMFLTCKNYKYGVTDFKGKTILENKFDDIYMPKSNIMRIKYEGRWYEIERLAATDLQLPEDIRKVKTDSNFKVTNLITDTGVISGYSVLTFSDYLIKVFSSISPAHEETIDELMLSQGAETVSIFIKLSWLPKYPFTYAKRYFTILKNPNNGPFIDVRNELKQKIK